MSDDWRVHLSLKNPAEARRIGRRLEHGELEHGLETGAGQRVVVSVDDDELFLYADSRAQAEAAAAALATMTDARPQIARWHPVAERWEDPNAPEPEGPAGLSEEQSELAVQERRESSRIGYAEYEVRIELPTHRETVELAQRLQQEGLPVIRRWKFLLIGAEDELDARRLAERLEGEVPTGSRVLVEGSTAAVAQELPNPFSVFGGLGG